VILADHVKSVDWKARQAEKTGTLPIGGYGRSTGQAGAAARLLKMTAFDEEQFCYDAGHN
jgi:hypothetical protein